MNNSKKLLKLTVNAVFIAIIAVMSFTPLGYLKMGTIEISLLAIPVAFGPFIFLSSFFFFRAGVFLKRTFKSLWKLCCLSSK